MKPADDVLSSNDVLRGIALNVLKTKYSTFLRGFAELYLLADEEEREILSPAWQKFIDKYLLTRASWVVPEEEG